jgi:hypothetical protein
MRRLNMMFSRYHNKRYKLDGHTFDGPYQAFRQATPYLMLHTIAYVFYNPVKGGLSRRPEDYPWSCCRCYLDMTGSPLTVEAGRLMASIDPDTKKVWSRFRQAMENEARRAAKATAGRPTMMELHQEQFEWLLEHAKEASDRLKGEDPTLVAMHWAREIGVTPKAMARVLGESMTGSIRVQLCRFNKRLKEDPELRERLALA